jgi:hypothetical protein
MAIPHGRRGTNYYLTVQQNGKFCVEIVTEGSPPAKLFNFAAIEQAEDWIANHRSALAKSPEERRRAFYVVSLGEAAGG